jgi:O-antigen ligase
MISIQFLRSFTFYCFMFSINFEMFNILNIASPSKIFAILYISTLVTDLKKFSKFDFSYKLTNIIFFLFFYITFISILNVNQYSYYFFDFTLFLNIILFFFIINHEREVPNIIERGLIFFAIGSIILTIFFFLGYGISFFGGRVSIFGDNENAIGLRLCISITILLYNIINNPFSLKIPRYIFLFSIPFIIIFMFTTGSRTATISLILILIIWVIFSKSLKFKNKIYIVSLFSLLLYYVSFYFLNTGTIVFTRIFRTIDKFDLAGRDRIWKEVIKIILDNPLTGIGNTGFYMQSSKVFGRYNSPHNVFLEILAFGGIIGLLLYLIFIFKIFFGTYKFYFKSNNILPILLIVIFFSMLMVSHALYSKISWIILAYCSKGYFEYMNSKNHF